MKKYISFLLAAVLLLCLCACGHSSADPDMNTVSGAVREAADSTDMTDTPDSYIENMINLPADSYSECYARISNVGININEFGVFKTDTPDDVEDALEAYLQFRKDTWMEEYLPQEYPKLEHAEIWRAGCYVMYIIADGATMDKAETAFKGCFEG